MEKTKPLLEVLDAVSHLDWTKKSAPATFTVFVLVGLGALAVVLNQLGIKLPSMLYVWSFAIIEVAAVSRWLYARWYRPFDTQMLSIGLALQPDQHSKEFYDAIMASLRRDVEEQGLSEVVQFRQLPTDLKFASNTEAEKYLVSKGLRVLIWGDTSRGTVHSESVSIFNVRFSCQHTTQSEDGTRQILSALEDGARRGVWSVQDTNSLEGVRVVAGNLVEVSAYVLAICLWSVGTAQHVEKAATILEKLTSRLKPRSQDINFPNLDDFKLKTNRLLRRVYTGLVDHYSVQKRDYKTAQPWGFKLLTLSPNNFDANIYLARISWELGDQSAARAYTKAARKAKPKEALPYLNFAFFHFYNGNYSKALACYRRLSDKVFKTNIIDVVEFLEREYDKTGKEALYFAAGWINHQYGDKERGKSMLLEFLQFAKGKGGLDKLMKEVEKLELS